MRRQHPALGLGDRIEMDVYDTAIESLALDDKIDVWREGDDDQTWVVQLTAKIDVRLRASVEVYKWDSIDREEIQLTSETCSFPHDVEVQFYLRITDVRLDTDTRDWEVEVDVGTGSYHLGHVAYSVF